MREDDPVRESAEGVLVSVRVQPKASRAGVGAVSAGLLKVAVNEPPDKGKANRAVEKLLARAVGIAPSLVEVVKGETSRRKTVLLRGTDAGGVRRKLGLGA